MGSIFGKIARIFRHVHKAKKKHSLFAIQATQQEKEVGIDRWRKLFTHNAIEYKHHRDETKDVYNVLMSEVSEMFAAYYEAEAFRGSECHKSMVEACREEIYDVIAVLIRFEEYIDKESKNEEGKGITEANH